MAQSNQDAFADALRVVRVAVPVPLKQAFDYVMAASDPIPAIGARVQVRFGSRRLVGICVAIDPQDPHQAPKPIDAVLDQEPALTPELMVLGQWLADYYHHPLGEVLHSLLPAPGRRGEPLRLPPSKGYRAIEGEFEFGRAQKQQALYQRLLPGPQARSTLLAEGYSAALIQALLKRGAIVE